MREVARDESLPLRQCCAGCLLKFVDGRERVGCRRHICAFDQTEQSVECPGKLARADSFRVRHGQTKQSEKSPAFRPQQSNGLCVELVQFGNHVALGLRLTCSGDDRFVQRLELMDRLVHVGNFDRQPRSRLKLLHQIALRRGNVRVHL